MMVERYPNLKEEVGGSIPGCEISSVLDKKDLQDCLLCFGVGMLASVSKKKKKKNGIKVTKP